MIRFCSSSNASVSLPVIVTSMAAILPTRGKAHSGQRYISPEIAQKMALKQLGGERDEDGELSLFERLSEREMQIAMMVVDCQKVQDISDKLCLSPKTVNSYRYRIFEKLEISSDVELALMAVRLGLLDADKV